MKCACCNDRFYQGEGLDVHGVGFVCWACSITPEVKAMKAEEEAFAVCNTSELYEMGLIDDSVLDALFAPWESEELAIAA